MAAFVVAHMGFLARVCSRMDGQGAALDETLVAVFDRAVVGSLIGMYSVVSTEIGFAIERLDGWSVVAAWSWLSEEIPQRHPVCGTIRRRGLPFRSAPTSS